MNLIQLVVNVLIFFETFLVVNFTKLNVLPEIMGKMMKVNTNESNRKDESLFVDIGYVFCTNIL